jgi:hypothetical protein
VITRLGLATSGLGVVRIVPYWVGQVGSPLESSQIVVGKRVRTFANRLRTRRQPPAQPALHEFSGRIGGRVEQGGGAKAENDPLERPPIPQQNQRCARGGLEPAAEPEGRSEGLSTPLGTRSVVHGRRPEGVEPVAEPEGRSEGLSTPWHTKPSAAWCTAEGREGLDPAAKAAAEAKAEALLGHTQPSAAWCTRRDLNPHTLRYRNLNPARLPVPPLVRGKEPSPGGADSPPGPRLPRRGGARIGSVTALRR